MSVNHHGAFPEAEGRDDSRQSELIKRMMDQIEGTARRAYPKGRMGHEDDGILSYAVAADPRHQTIVIRFGKPVEWIGLGVDDVDSLIEKLSEMKLKLRGVTI